MVDYPKEPSARTALKGIGSNMTILRGIGSNRTALKETALKKS